MSYPLTSAVSAGDPTLASHYNNLRLDALFLGQTADDAVNLGTALERYESRLTLESLNTTQVRVPASAAAPVSLLVDGYMVQAVANIDLAVGDAPSGAAAAYYVFANRADSSTSFTLSVSTSATELSNQRLIGRFYWDGAKIVRDSVRTDLARHIANILYFIDPQTCDGRLTAATNDPVPVIDINSSNTLYFTPYVGNRIALYVQDYGWRIYTFGELSLSVTGLSTSGVYDIFIYDNAGSLALSSLFWASGTVRATALIRQDGVWVKSGAPEYRYLGTIRIDAASSIIRDDHQNRFVWNMYNRVEKTLYLTEATNSWTYVNTNVWRILNNDWANNVCRMVVGINESLLTFESRVYAENSTANEIGVGVCVDAGNDNLGLIRCGNKDAPANYNEGWYGSIYKGYPGIGYHTVVVTELSGGGTTTFYGDNGVGNSEQLSGGFGSLCM